MAIIRDNVLTEGLSGAFGNNFVFKQLRGKTVVSKRAAKPRTQSVEQKENRNRFRQASEWAKSILLEHDKKTYYQKKARKLKLPNAYTAAIADYMRSATVLHVNQYADKITFSIYKKDFDVAQVDLVLKTDAGEKKIRKLPRGESYFWLQQGELNAGVVVMVTDAAGVVREYTLVAA